MTEHKPVTPYGVDIYGDPIHVVWWKDHNNLITLCNWLAKNGRSGGEVAYAVEKPWKYEDEFDEAAKEQEAS